MVSTIQRSPGEELMRVIEYSVWPMYSSGVILVVKTEPASGWLIRKMGLVLPSGPVKTAVMFPFDSEVAKPFVFTVKTMVARSRRK